LSKNTRGTAIIIALILIFAGVLTLGIIKDKKANKDNKADYNESLEEPKTTKVVAQNEETKGTVDEALNFYGKLKNKKDAKILILGDGLALSQGSTSNGGVWDTGLVNLLENTYGSKVDLISLAKAGAASSVGLDTAKNNNLEGYDLVITCFGHNDNNSAVNINDFKLNYAGIVTIIKEKSPKAIVLPILPSTLALDNKYRAKIQEIATENGLTCIDTKTGFTKSGIAEAKLLNGTLPNDTGYQIYTQTMAEIIKAGLE